MDQNKEANFGEIEIVSVNINSDRRASEKVISDALKECHISARIDEILDLVSGHLCRKQETIICLFEIDSKTLDFITKWCTIRNIIFVKGCYNLSQDSFHFLVMTNQICGFVSNNIFPLTKSGCFYKGERDKSSEQLEETLQDVYEKSLFHVETFSGLHIWVTHLSLGNEAKMLQMKKIAEIVRPFNNSVLVGDFNCFDRNVKEQAYLKGMFDPMSDIHWTHLSKDWDSTFDNQFFPYDLEYLMVVEDKKTFSLLKESGDHIRLRNFLLELPKKYRTKGLALDHVFTNLECVKAKFEMRPLLTDHAFLQIEIKNH